MCVLIPVKGSTKARLQCDESKPSCDRCAAYGVFCYYYTGQPDLQLSAEKALDIVILPQSLNQVVPGVLAPSLRKQGEQNLELLNKFQSRTILSITTDANLHIFKNEMIKLASSVNSLFSSSQTLRHTKLINTAPVSNPCSPYFGTDARPLPPTYFND